MGWLAGMLALFAAIGLVPVAASAGLEAFERETQTIHFDGADYDVEVPRGYVFEVLVPGLRGARMPTFASNGDLLIGSKRTEIYRLPPPYTRPEVLVHLEDLPQSLALRNGELLIARTHGLYRVPYAPGQASVDPNDVTLLAPVAGSGPHHLTRTVGIGPDGRVYLSLGMTGNCGDNYLDESYPPDLRRGGVLVLREDDGPPRWETHSSGLRNPVGFGWHPQTHALYATNNGPDHWGFELPPEQFTLLTPGSFHGMPWFQFDGKQIVRDTCAKKDPPRPKSEVVPPVLTFPAHNAPVGLRFVPEGALDARFTADAIVALHGSWVANKHPKDTRPSKLVAVRFEDGVARRVDELVTGFQPEGRKRWARMAGVAFGPDGALYFTSDRKPGGLFRLRRVH